MARPTQTLTPDERDAREDQERSEVDTAPYASTLASLDNKVDSIVYELVNRKRRVRPVPYKVNSGKTTPAGPLTYNFLDLGGPPNSNRIWNVMRYSTWGIDPFTNVTGSVFPFIAPAAPNDSNTEPLFVDVVDIAVVIANIATWSGHQLTLRFGEHLVLCYKGVPASTSLYGIMQGEEEDLLDFRVDRD